jgi:class 3 adenylate cyclase
MTDTLEADLDEMKAWTRRNQMRRAVLVLVLTICSGVLGQAYGDLFYGDVLVDAVDKFRGFRTGAMIGFIATAIEVYYIRSVRRSWIRRTSFWKGIIVRIVVITLIIRAVLNFNIAITNSLLGAPIFSDVTAGREVRDTLVSLAIVLFFVIFSQFSTIIGPRRFINLVAGRYFRPQAEQRIFMFVDLVGSTALALKLGDIKFHEYLSEFFYQIDKAIVRYGAEVVSYVGDAVILTFPLSDDTEKNGRILSGIRAMQFAIRQQEQSFEKDFGVVPVFRVAVHGGPVVVGECGDSRRQVTFLGDTVNMTARMETAAKTIDEPFLISSDLASKVSVPHGITLDPLGPVNFKGANEPVNLHRIRFSGALS